MRVLFVNTHLRTGGIATSLVNLLKELANRTDLSIDLMLLNPVADERYRIDERIHLVQAPYLLRIRYSNYDNVKNTPLDALVWWVLRSIGKLTGPRLLLRLILALSPSPVGYGMVVSYANDIYCRETYMGCNGYVTEKVTGDCVKIGWVHNDPNALGMGCRISRRVYGRFDRIINVSYTCKQKFDRIFPEYASKSLVVYNIFDYDRIRLKGTEENPLAPFEGKKLVTVARIYNQQKRIDRIIDVCKKLEEEGVAGYHWFIVGNGPDLAPLKQRVCDLELNHRLLFVGHQSNPYAYMRHADCFVLVSDYEAQGMVLVEALACGTPVIVTDFEEAQEFVDDGVTGLIVPKTVEGVYEAVKRILFDETSLVHLAEGIKNECYSNDLAHSQFDNLLIEKGYS